MTARVIRVIELKLTVGDGTPGNLYREITKILTLDGKLICEIDPRTTSSESRRTD